MMSTYHITLLYIPPLFLHIVNIKNWIVAKAYLHTQAPPLQERSLGTRLAKALEKGKIELE